MRKVVLLFFCATLFWACGSNDKKTMAQPENDVDAASMFIRAALNGNYKEAATMIVPDSLNKEDLASAERLYLKNDAVRQRGLRESSIRIHETRKLSDSVSIIEYSNSFTQQHQQVKAVRLNNQWLIDFKYTFQQTDSIKK